MWTPSMPNLFAEERRLIMDYAISYTDAENLVLKTWMAMTLGLASPSNEQLEAPNQALRYEGPGRTGAMY
jgi:hypothetical protein